MGPVLRALVALSCLLFGLGISSCGTSQADGTAMHASPREAVRIIGAGTHTVVDLRRPEQFAAGHVAGAVNLDPAAPDFATQVERLDEDARYLVYAQTAAQSEAAAGRLVLLGLGHVVDAGAYALLAIAGAQLE
jgi:rhodanese-related sulfurtransferase